MHNLYICCRVAASKPGAGGGGGGGGGGVGSAGYLLLVPSCEVPPPLAMVAEEEAVQLSSQVHVFDKILQAGECGRHVATRCGVAARRPAGCCAGSTSHLQVGGAAVLLRLCQESPAAFQPLRQERFVLPGHVRDSRDQSSVSCEGLSELHACNLKVCRCEGRCRCPLVEVVRHFR